MRFSRLFTAVISGFLLNACAPAHPEAANPTRGNEAQKHRLVQFVSDEVVPWMVEEAGNDRAKLKAMIHELQTHREKFLRTRLPASLKAKGDVLIQQMSVPQN